jgi:hypothetical protein
MCLPRVTFYLATISLLLPAWSAFGATFQYDGYTITNGQAIQILTPNNVADNNLGQIVLQGTGTNAGQVQAAWCLDVYDFLTTSGTYTVGPLTTVGSGGSNPTLSDAQISEIGSLMVQGTASINSSTDVSAAIQLAIWKLEYGASFSYSGASSSVEGLADQYESNVMPGGQWFCPDCTVTLFSLDGDQNLGMGSPPATSRSGAGATPLPAALPLFASGAGGLGLLSWRCRKKNAVAKIRATNRQK